MQQVIFSFFLCIKTESVRRLNYFVTVEEINEQKANCFATCMLYTVSPDDFVMKKVEITVDF